LLIKGYSYKEIAAALFISVETLNSHIKNIYRKLDVHSRSELAAKYGNSI
jgi:DNA-binding CsgD family transcriptional regulator